MKYWLLTTEYPPFFGGGISTYCFHTAAMLSAAGYTITVFVNDTAVRDFVIEQHGKIRVVRFNPDRSKGADFLGHVTNISYGFAGIIKKFVEEEGKPDLIEAQEYLGIAYYLLQYKYLLYDWCRDIPVIITIHSPSFLYMEYNRVPVYRYPNFWICEMERFCMQAADKLIAPSNYILKELEKRFSLLNKQVSVIPNPYEAGKRPLDLASKDGELVFYGKLTAQKGVFEMLLYFERLWEKGFSRPLFLIGGQDIIYHPEGISMGVLIRKKYKKYIENGLLKLENKLHPSRLEDRLQTAEIVIIPSNNDNLPYVVLEVMALGKIVLVSEQGGQAEVVVDGQNGFIFSHEKPESFSMQLKHILELTENERRAISFNARETIIKKYTLSAISRQKLDVAERLIDRKISPSGIFPYIRSRPVSDEQDVISGTVTLSVIIPYYNMGKFIGRSIRSVKMAQVQGMEILLVNDGSTDSESLQELDKLRNDKNIRVIDSTNRGVAAARNLGMENARGLYIAFLDPDDLVEPGYYSRALAVLQQYPTVHFVGCWTKYIDGSEKTWPGFSPEPPLILYHNLVNSSALIFRKNSYLKAGMNDTSMPFQGLEDYACVISMVAKGFNGVVIPEVLFNYCVRGNSMIRDITRTKKIILSQYITTKYQDFYKEYTADLIGLMNTNGTGLVLDNPTLDYHLADKLPLGQHFSLKMIRLIKKNGKLKTIAYKIYRLIKR